MYAHIKDRYCLHVRFSFFQEPERPSLSCATQLQQGPSTARKEGHAKSKVLQRWEKQNQQMPSGSTWALSSVASEFTCQKGIPLWSGRLEFDPGSTAPGQVSFSELPDLFSWDFPFISAQRASQLLCHGAVVRPSEETQKAVILSNPAQVLIPAGSFLAQVRNKLTFIFQQSTKEVSELSSSLGGTCLQMGRKGCNNTDHARVHRHSCPHHLNRNIHPWTKHYSRQGRWKAGVEGLQREDLDLILRVNLLVPWQS